MKINIYAKSLYSVFLVLILCSCNLNEWNLDNDSNELIPNYSISLQSIRVNPTMQSDIIALSDEEFLMAIEVENSEINLIRISQIFVEDEWELDDQLINTYGVGVLRFFDTINGDFLLGVINPSKEFVVSRIDEDFNIITQSSPFDSFIDTTYNSIDSLDFSNYSLDTTSNEILLCGRVYTQGVNYSCVLNIDENLEPQWFKTYFEDSEIVDVVSMSRDTFLLLNSEDDGGTDLIMDNKSGSIYKKFNLSNEELFFGIQSLESDGILHLAGIENDVVRTIEVDLSSESAFVVDVEVYPVSDFRALFLSRDNIVTAGIQIVGTDQYLFASELESFGSIWCNRYIDEQYVKILDLIELPGKGILISAIVENQGISRLHLIRVDEEGATFVNEYSENCI